MLIAASLALATAGCIIGLRACIKGKADRFAAWCAERGEARWQREAAELRAERDALAARLTRKPSVMAMRREKVAETTAILRAEVEARG